MEGDRRSQPVNDNGVTPQSQPLLGQIANERGGHSYRVTDIICLKRFLCLGVDDRVYRANTQHTHFSRSNVSCIDRLIQAGRGQEVVNLIKEISLQGRACKHDTTIYALAFCCKSNDPTTKHAAFQVLSDVCRIPTHLFQFIKYSKSLVENSNGWGRASRMGISNWYNSFKNEDPGKSGNKLAYLVTKYNRRHGWTHRDAIRMAHVKPKTPDIRLIIEYLLGQNLSLNEGNVVDFLNAVNKAKKSRNENEIKQLIAEYRLSREHIPTRLLNKPEIWQALFVVMPFTAMLRSLGKMTSLGLFDSRRCIEANSNIDVLKKRLENINSGLVQYPKIHPLTLLITLKHYQLGKARNEIFHWTPNDAIVIALKKAFEEQTKILPTTGKSYLIAMSVGADMQNQICGSSITASQAAAAMILSTVHTEGVEVLMFANSIEDARTSSIDRDDNLDSIEAKIKRVRDTCTAGGLISEDEGTPFKWAADKQMKFDVMIIFTSSLSTGGYLHPAEMLQQYVSLFAVKDFKLIVVGMCDNKYTCASPENMNALDVVGFDLHVPIIIRDFVSDFEGDSYTQAVHSDLDDIEAFGNLTLYE